MKNDKDDSKKVEEQLAIAIKVHNEWLKANQERIKNKKDNKDGVPKK